MLPQMETSPTESEKAIEVNSRLKQNEQTSTSNATERQPVGEEVSMLAEKLKSTSYYQIRSAIYRHLAVKDEAWKQLSPEEQLKIERLLP
jgi:negative regulator of replication initiation